MEIKRLKSIIILPALLAGLLELLVKCNSSPLDVIIPAGMSVSDLDSEGMTRDFTNHRRNDRPDELQKRIARYSSRPGNNNNEITPAIPSLCRAASEHPDLFNQYLAHSLNWGQYKGGYATRAWRISGRPSTNNLTDYGVHSASPFQTSTEIHPNSRFLDKAPPGVSRPQYIDQGEEPIKVELDGRTSKGFMSRIMLQCHNSPVGVEIHEISDNHERRATKATIDQLEHEFSDFVKDPESIILLEKKRFANMPPTWLMYAVTSFD